MNKKLIRYYTIYEHIYDNPKIPICEISEKTRLSRNTVSRYLKEMYDKTIIEGPSISLSPAPNYHEYASFLEFTRPFSAFENFCDFPHVIERTLGCGLWNVFLVSEGGMDFSALRGLQQNRLQSVKSCTYIPKVLSLKWEKSVEKIHETMTFPRAKTTLYQEKSPLPWKKRQWTLYHTFRPNLRVPVVSALKKCRQHFDVYRPWVSALENHGLIQTGFYPSGSDNYVMIDFLFKSDYHRQLMDVLQWLPSSCTFFSAEHYFFARICVLNRTQQNELLSLLEVLRERRYYTRARHTLVIKRASSRG